MGLRERLGKIKEHEQLDVAGSEETPLKQEQKKFLYDIKTYLHKLMIEQLDLDSLAKLQNEKDARVAVKTFLSNAIEEKKYPISDAEKRFLIQELEHDTFGLGLLEPLLSDATVDEILVNGPNNVFVERFGKIEKTPLSFSNEGHLRQIIDRIVARVGRRVDEASPMVDARLKDGSRVNAIIPPLAIDGSSLSIRKFKKEPLQVKDLIRYGSFTEKMITLFEIAVKGKLNIIISGGTGTGKTTLLNLLSSFIPDGDRIITIEDTAELQLRQPHVVRLETRPPNTEGKGGIAQRELVINALRMRPDRIVMGEVRGGEALDMLQAMNTGHEGSLTTIHANTPRDVLLRLETMVMCVGGNLTHHAIIRQIASAIHLIVQITRYPDGVRRVSSITEILGMEGDVITMHDIVKFKQTGVKPDRSIEGHFEFTGVKPHFVQVMKDAGMLDSMNLGADYF